MIIVELMFYCQDPEGFLSEKKFGVYSADLIEIVAIFGLLTQIESKKL